MAILAWFPDYSIKVVSQGDVVALFGTAQGTRVTKENPSAEAHWQIPAVWKAVIRGGRVAKWRVYADNGPVWKAMGVKRY